MKFGIREICDVVYRARSNMKVGNKVFYKGEPVIYFDTLKTSTLEGAVTTVYAQGGRGNSRLVAWDGERTVTFTMEDALISPEGLMILTGAGLIDATAENKIYVHATERIAAKKIGEDDATIKFEGESVVITVGTKDLANDPNAVFYVMIMNGDDIDSEPFMAFRKDNSHLEIKTNDNGNVDNGKVKYEPKDLKKMFGGSESATEITAGLVVLADYYIEKSQDAQQINIGPESFGGNFYVEASTLFRNKDGVDMPAEFIIPNARVQSNFTFSMASSGDPSTFTFTMDAFPEYTRFDPTEKVFCSIQVINEANAKSVVRTQTKHAEADDAYFN